VSEPLQLWTVYERPSDFPELFVARRHDVFAGVSVPTGTYVTATTLEGLRELLRGMGLTFLLAREPGDDPVIVETWI
jgi:hypothetical protein